MLSDIIHENFQVLLEERERCVNILIVIIIAKFSVHYAPDTILHAIHATIYEVCTISILPVIEKKVEAQIWE